MRIEVINKDFEINTTPLEILSADAYTVNVELDDISENRYILKCKPYVAYKVTTIDCVSSTNFYNEYCFREGRYHRHILEVIDSDWIKELRKNNGSAHHFLKRARHFALPLQDIVVEIISDEMEVIVKR